MKLTKKQLYAAHQMEAAAILAAGDLMLQVSEDTRGILTLMLALKVIQDDYPDLYSNVANAPALITEWLATGAKEMNHPMFAKRPAGARLLNFPEWNETKH